MTPLLYKIGAAVVIGALLFGSGYLKGHGDGRIDQLADTVAAYEKRKGIDGDVADMDDVAVCVELGGLRDECEQLRGLDAPAEGERAGPSRW